MSMVGIVGGIEVCDIFERPGDLREDCEDVDCISAREEEFLRVDPEVLDADLSLREKRPIPAVLWLRVGCSGFAEWDNPNF